jgi:hypothetical protein
VLVEVKCLSKSAWDATSTRRSGETLARSGDYEVPVDPRIDMNAIPLHSLLVTLYLSLILTLYNQVDSVRDKIEPREPPDLGTIIT